MVIKALIRRRQSRMTERRKEDSDNDNEQSQSILPQLVMEQNNEMTIEIMQDPTMIFSSDENERSMSEINEKEKHLQQHQERITKAVIQDQTVDWQAEIEQQEKEKQRRLLEELHVSSDDSNKTVIPNTYATRTTRSIKQNLKRNTFTLWKITPADITTEKVIQDITKSLGVEASKAIYGVHRDTTYKGRFHITFNGDKYRKQIEEEGIQIGETKIAPRAHYTSGPPATRGYIQNLPLYAQKEEVTNMLKDHGRVVYIKQWVRPDGIRIGGLNFLIVLHQGKSMPDNVYYDNEEYAVVYEGKIKRCYNCNGEYKKGHICSGRYDEERAYEKETDRESQEDTDTEIQKEVTPNVLTVPNLPDNSALAEENTTANAERPGTPPTKHRKVVPPSTMVHFFLGHHTHQEAVEAFQSHTQLDLEFSAPDQMKMVDGQKTIGVDFKKKFVCEASMKEFLASHVRIDGEALVQAGREGGYEESPDDNMDTKEKRRNKRKMPRSPGKNQKREHAKLPKLSFLFF